MADNTSLAPQAGQRRRDVRRTALLLASVAAIFYVGFIAMMIWRATR